MADPGPLDFFAPPILVNALLLSKKRVCTRGAVAPYALGAFPESSSTEDRAREDAQTQVFDLTSDKNTYYKEEDFYLHVSANSHGAQAEQNKGTDATYYLWERSPDGTTRFDEMSPAGTKNALGDWDSGFQLDFDPARRSVFDLNSGSTSRWTGLGDHTFEVFQPIGSSGDGRIVFAHSNILHVQIAEASAMPRTWSPKVKGIALDVTLDKDTFRLGEDIPVHVALENFDADVPLYDPAPMEHDLVEIEVRDANGQPIPNSWRFPNHAIFVGNGSSVRYAKGELVPLERNLGLNGWLPNRPGTYTITVTWTPWGNPNKNESASSGITRLGPAPAPYATAQATATIHIIDGDN